MPPIVRVCGCDAQRLFNNMFSTSYTLKWEDGCKASLQQRHNLFLRWQASDLDIVFVDEDIDLAADTKFWQVNARFDRATGRGQQSTFVACLKIIHVRAVSMHYAANAMACAMHKVIAIASLRDHRSRGIIDFAALHGDALRQSLASEGDAGISRPPHNLEYLALASRDIVACACEGHPGIIGDDGIRLRQARPEVEQHQVAATDRAAIAAARLVMGIAGIGVDGHMRITRR